MNAVRVLGVSIFFLTGTAVRATAARIDCASLLVDLPPIAKPYAGRERVIVIGAGVAGLTAARLLRAKGISVVVLEGRDRVGGRVTTRRDWGDRPVDLGASWIHGVRDNVLAHFARRAAIATRMTDYYDSYAIYGENGLLLSEPEQKRLEKLYRQLQRRLDPARNSFLPGVSLGEELERSLAEMQVPVEDARRLRFLFQGEIEQDYATEASDLSARSYGEAVDFRGGDVLVPGGYDAIPNRLARGFTKDEIRLGHSVSRIERVRGGVRVTTNHGVFEGTRVFVSVPLGVLKSGAIEFVPALPERKQQAIRRLRMGTLNKLYLRFDRPFWPDVDFISYAGRESESWTPFFNLAKYGGGPVLVGFYFGEQARELEGLSDREVAARAMPVLRKIYGDRIPEPSDALYTRWSNDPWALGSYSHPGPDATGEDFDALAAPVGKRLFFLGEATSRESYGTVHGAMLSGFREVERIFREGASDFQN